MGLRDDEEDDDDDDDDEAAAGMVGSAGATPAPRLKNGASSSVVR